MATMWFGGSRQAVMTRIAPATGFSSQTLMTAVLALTLTAADAVLGWVFVGTAFAWAFSVTSILLRLIRPQRTRTTPVLSQCVGMAANWTAALAFFNGNPCLHRHNGKPKDRLKLKSGDDWSNYDE